MTTTDDTRRVATWHVTLTTVALMTLGGLLVMAGGAAGGTATPIASAVRSDRPVENVETVTAPIPETPAPARKPAGPEASTPDDPPSVSAVEPAGARERRGREERRETVRPSIRDEDDDDDEDDESSDESSAPKPEDPDSDEKSSD